MSATGGFERNACDQAMHQPASAAAPLADTRGVAFMLHGSATKGIIAATCCSQHKIRVSLHAPVFETDITSGCHTCCMLC
jgi:hypothetical protein